MRSRIWYADLLQLADREFPDIVQRGEFVGGSPNNPHKARLRFRDGSYLDIWFSSAGDYAYHWEHRTQDGKIHRWDNAPHFPNIETNPHHVHWETEYQVQPSTLPWDTPQSALRTILTFIRTYFSHG